MTNTRILVASLLSAVAVAVGTVVLMGPTDEVGESQGAAFGTPIDAAPLTSTPSAVAWVDAPSSVGQRQEPLVEDVELEGAEIVAPPAEPLSVAELGANAAPAEEVQWLRNAVDEVIRWRYGKGDRLDLRGKDLAGADLDYVDLANADLREANLKDTGLQGADLRGANLQGAIIEGTYLQGVDLREAILSETDIGPVNVSSADLRAADLRGARLACRDCGVWSTAMSSNFSRADLRGLDFGYTRIDSSVFDEADLRGADLGSTRGKPLSLRGAMYDDRTRFPDNIDPVAWDMVLVGDNSG